MSKPICGHCVAEVQLFKQCPNLTAGHCAAGDAALTAVSKPICPDCVAEVQLFKRCRNLSAGTVLQRCSCLSSVKTYLPVSQFILPPGQLASLGASKPRLAYPPGGKLSWDILPPTLVIFTLGGQAVQAGLSCPPPNTSKNIYMLFCYFSVSF